MTTYLAFGHILHYAVVYRQNGNFRADLFENEQQAVKHARSLLHSTDGQVSVQSVEADITTKPLYVVTRKLKKIKQLDHFTKV